MKFGVVLYNSVVIAQMCRLFPLRDREEGEGEGPDRGIAVTPVAYAGLLTFVLQSINISVILPVMRSFFPKGE
jgi:hypothetical protein